MSDKPKPELTSEQKATKEGFARVADALSDTNTLIFGQSIPSLENLVSKDASIVDSLNSVKSSIETLGESVQNLQSVKATESLNSRISNGYVKLSEGPMYPKLTDIGPLPDKGSTIMVILRNVATSNHMGAVRLQVTDMDKFESAKNVAGEMPFYSNMGDYHNGREYTTSFEGPQLSVNPVDIMFRIDDFRQVWGAYCFVDDKNPMKMNSVVDQEFLASGKPISHLRFTTDVWSPLSQGTYEIYLK